MIDDPNADEDLIPPDTRRVTRLLDALVQKDGELSDSDDEGDGDRRAHTSNRDWDAEMHDADAEEDAAGREREAGAEAEGTGVDKGKGKEEEPTIARASTGRVPTGIMNPGTTKGAGPTASGHPVVVSIVPAPAADKEAAAMEVDEPELSEVR